MIILIAVHISSDSVVIYRVTKRYKALLVTITYTWYINCFLSLTELNRISNGNKKVKNNTWSYSPHGDKVLYYWEVLIDKNNQTVTVDIKEVYNLCVLSIYSRAEWYRHW